MPVTNKNEIAFCGIACGRCIKGRGEAKASARQILEDMQASELDRWQQHEPKQEQFDYDDLKKGLKWLTSLDCDGCHAEGCNPGCVIRKCAKEMGVDNCGVCPKMPCDIVMEKKEKTGIDIEKNFRCR
jgi:hypothetical protein